VRLNNAPAVTPTSIHENEHAGLSCTVQCPHSGREHVHGWAAPGKHEQPVLGYRAAHCHSGKGYRLEATR
jgi:hypothetical protein